MLSRVARALAGVSLLLCVAALAAGLALIVLTRGAPVRDLYAFRGAATTIALPFALTGSILVARRPRNPIGWLLLLGGLQTSFSVFGEGYAARSLTQHDGALPGTTLIAWLQHWGWAPMVAPMIIYPLLLYPTGTLPSRRWRIVGWATIPTIALMSIGVATEPGRLLGIPGDVDNPYAIDVATNDLVYSVAGPPLIVVVVLAVIALWRRFRRSSGDEHLQIKWLLFAGAVTVICLLASLGFVLTNTPFASGPGRVLGVATNLSLGGIAAAAGIGVLKYRLYDIDVVIDRTLTFGALATFITTVYVGAVTLVGIGLGADARSNAVVSIAVTALIALVFHPLRQRSRRFAERVVYGRRVSAREVLSELGSTLATNTTIDQALPGTARLVVDATAAERATIWLAVDGMLEPAASWPETGPDGAHPGPIPIVGVEPPALPDADHHVPVHYDGELLGVIAVGLRRGETLSSADRRILADLTAPAALAMRNARLLADLRASRQRLVAAQDSERRKIERDLHDGAAQHLVGLGIKLDLAKRAATGSAQELSALLDELRAQTTDALDALRTLARGIYPPLLASGGLAVALPALAHRSPVPLVVRCDDVGRFAREVEATVYFCVLEALQNAAKYAGATGIALDASVDGDRHGDALVFSVRDDGAGFDPRTVARGAGLTNMGDRLDAIGGTLSITSTPGAGTTVAGVIPLPRARRSALDPEQRPETSGEPPAATLDDPEAAGSLA